MEEEEQVLPRSLWEMLNLVSTPSGGCVRAERALPISEPKRRAKESRWHRRCVVNACDASPS